MEVSKGFIVSFAVIFAALLVCTEGRCSVGPSQLPPNCTCPQGQPQILQCVCPMANGKMTELPAKELIPSDVTFLLFLDCRFQTIKEVPYTQLKSLHIRNSGVSGISDYAFSSLVDLETLDLSANELYDVSKIAFNGLYALSTLIMSGNNLENLQSDVFETVQNLEKLDLSYNKGLQLPDDIFDKVPKLRTVEIRQCGFNSIPTAVTKLPHLSELDLDLNSLQSLEEDDFTSMPNLVTLGMDSCAIESISEGAFDPLTQLRVLNLGHNHIRSVNRRHFEAFRDTLHYLYIEHNELETLSEDVLNWDNVKDASLGHNPWICDCRIDWITEKLASKHNKENVTCMGPEMFAGKPLFNITGHMPCGDGGGNSAVALAIAIPIIIICCVLIGYYAYKIYQNKKKGQRKSVRYSAVYKDTVESAKFKPSYDI